MSLNSVGSFFGDIEKAIIEIIDFRGQNLNLHTNQNQAGFGTGLRGSFLEEAGQSSLTNSVSKLAEEAKVDMDAFKAGASKKRYVVQFNPTSISLKGRGQGYMPILSYDKNGKTAGPDKQSVRVFFSVRLVIDQVDNFDAFLEDKMNVSPTQLGQNILKQIPKFKKEVTVKDTVEGFIAAIRSPYTRIITFHWGSMNYSGILNNVNAQYVMFNRKGQPVRAYINLSLQCMHDDPHPNSLGPWEKAYEKAFGENGIAQNRAVGAAQKYGSFLNLG